MNSFEKQVINILTAENELQRHYIVFAKVRLAKIVDSKSDKGCLDILTMVLNDLHSALAVNEHSSDKLENIKNGFYD